MVFGIGIDLLETKRLERAIRRFGDRFEERIFTETERAQCRPRADRFQALAARFAAKEACLKALGTGWSEGLSFAQVEVARGPGGRPELRLLDRVAERARREGINAAHVSLTHQPGMAGAVVVLERVPESELSPGP